jgi:hypothetical protein
MWRCARRVAVHARAKCHGRMWRRVYSVQNRRPVLLQQRGQVMRPLRRWPAAGRPLQSRSAGMHARRATGRLRVRSRSLRRRTVAGWVLLTANVCLPAGADRQGTALASDDLLVRGRVGAGALGLRGPKASSDGIAWKRGLGTPGGRRRLFGLPPNRRFRGHRDFRGVPIRAGGNRSELALSPLPSGILRA